MSIMRRLRRACPSGRKKEAGGMGRAGRGTRTDGPTAEAMRLAALGRGDAYALAQIRGYAEGVRDKGAEAGASEAQELAAYVLSLLAPSRSWQDILTAPRDGSRVLLYRRGWAESMGVGWYGRDGWELVGGSPMPGPSHWQPLPPPPQGERA